MGIVSFTLSLAAPATRRVELRTLLWREHCLEHGACLQPQQLLVGDRLAQRLRGGGCCGPVELRCTCHRAQRRVGPAPGKVQRAPPGRLAVQDREDAFVLRIAQVQAAQEWRRAERTGFAVALVPLTERRAVVPRTVRWRHRLGQDGGRGQQADGEGGRGAQSG